MDTYIPITMAAQLTHTSVSGLNQLVQVGKIRSVMTITGEILVSAKDIDPVPSREQFDHLSGQGIGIREAEEKYGVSNVTISRWAARGWIKVLHRGHRGQRTLLDEQDVAYMAAKYKQNPGQGKRTDMM